jgi:hypothetical protein
MGLKPPPEPVQETPSRGIANPIWTWPGPGSSLGFHSLRHISTGGAITSGFQTALRPTRRVSHPLREHLLSPPTDHVSGQSVHGIATLQGIDRHVFRLEPPPGGPWLSRRFLPLPLVMSVQGSGNPCDMRNASRGLRACGRKTRRTRRPYPPG